MKTVLQYRYFLLLNNLVVLVSCTGCCASRRNLYQFLPMTSSTLGWGQGLGLVLRTHFESCGNGLGGMNSIKINRALSQIKKSKSRSQQSKNQKIKTICTLQSLMKINRLKKPKIICVSGGQGTTLHDTITIMNYHHRKGLSMTMAFACSSTTLISLRPFLLLMIEC